MELLIKMLSRYAFLNMILLNIAIPILIGYISLSISSDDELITILAVGFFTLNVSFMVMISSVLSRINRFNTNIKP